MNSHQLKFIFRILFALFFIVAGVMHFIKTDFFVSIVPPVFPYPLNLVKISGVCEILGGLGLLIPGLRRVAGYGLILLLIAVFPCNVYMLMQNFHQNAFSMTTVLLTLRLPLQVVFIQVVNILSRYP